MSQPHDPAGPVSVDPVPDRPRVVVGVGGGIAAYKACELVRRFTESGHVVTVVPTRAALAFVGEPTWAALSGRRVAADVWTDVHEVPHVRIGREADLVVVAPATADLLARATHGLADDLLTNVLLTATCPVVMAPAMHTEMWEHAATRTNVATLRGRGVTVLEPAEGRLTGADTGKGRLPDPVAIFEAARDLLARGSSAQGRGADLTGRRVVVSAGGTREPLDPVRYLGNHSSGRQGPALARTALARGATVTLVAAHTDDLPDPAGVEVVRVGTTEELRTAVLAAVAGDPGDPGRGPADAVVMAAAPADFRAAATSGSKIKKADDGASLQLDLVQNPDILHELSVHRASPGTVVVGFAAETGDATGTVLDLARAKLARKGCDLLVVNDVSGGGVFGREDNQAVIISPDADPVEVPLGPKAVVAHAVWDQVARRLQDVGAPDTV